MRRPHNKLEGVMSMKSRLRTLLCCGLLQMGVLLGVPMRPEHVRELMRDLNLPKIARTSPDQREHGDSLPPR
jgi:hypothetical protein